MLLEPSHLACENAKCFCHFWNVSQFLLKLNIHLTYYPPVPLSVIFQENKNHISTRKLYREVYSSIINDGPTLETLKCSLTDKMDKQIVIHLYNGILLNNKKNKLSIHLTIWIHLKSIMLKEWVQTQKATYYMIPFIWYSGKANLQRAAVRSGARTGRRGLIVKEHERMSWGDENILYFNYVLKVIEIHTLKVWMFPYVNYMSVKLPLKHI